MCREYIQQQIVNFHVFLFPFVSKTASSQELKSIVLAVWLKEEDEKTAMDVLEQRGSPLQCGFGYASHWV